MGIEDVRRRVYPEVQAGGFADNDGSLLFYARLNALLEPHMRVLDFACGSGILLSSLSDDGRHVFATDLVLDIARDVATELELERVTFLDIELWEGAIDAQSLDVVIAANVLEHVDDRQGLLRKLSSKLRPGGRLVISGPTENAIYRLGRRIVGFTGHYHVSNIYDCIADAKAVGLREVSLRRWPLPGPTALYLIGAYVPVR